MKWTALVVTHKKASDDWCDAFTLELESLHKKQHLGDFQHLIVVEDPSGAVGSGGATLNALLVAVEKLCSLSGLTTVTADILKESRILIVHQGRNSWYFPAGNAFLPLQERAGGPVTNLENIVNVSTQLAARGPSGVWIASTDMILQGSVDPLDWPGFLADALLLTVPVSENRNSDLGNVHYKENGLVESISFGENDERVENIVAGLVYVSSPVAEVLLELHTIYPLDCCTYLGEDNGAPPLKLSLFFDLLSPLWLEATRDQYIQGIYGESYDKLFSVHDRKNDLKQKARSIIWDRMNGFKLAAKRLNSLRHVYLTDTSSLEKTLFATVRNVLVDSSLPAWLNSFVSDIDETNMTNLKNGFLINSCVRSQPKGLQKIALIGTSANVDMAPDLHAETALIGYNICYNEKTVEAYAILHWNDIPRVDVREGTYFSVPLLEYLRRKGIRCEDLWPHTETRELYTAKLFCLPTSLTHRKNLLWLQDMFDTSRLEVWRQSVRFSMEDFMAMLDPQVTLRHLRNTYADVVMGSIESFKKPPFCASFMPDFRTACAEGWELNLLRIMDGVAAQSPSGLAAKLLASQADLLGCMAGNEAGLRSGPAANKGWKNAFYLLEHVSIEEGVLALAEERQLWLNHPNKILRAARHYERAAQILIRCTVKSVREQIALGPLAVEVPQNIWIQAECPARIDFQGGWSDTPPICYELGGSVINLAIRVNGKKPIGAKARKMTEPVIRLFLGEETKEIVSEITLRSVEDVFSFNNPALPGALFKAVIVCAEMVRLDGGSLESQLVKNCGGGFELHGWSQLPQGSGLGTSSILAGCLLATVWTLMGKSYARSTLIHAVLYIEQLMTTGGGWQDQVGGIMGGANRGWSPSSAKVYVGIDPIELSDEMVSLLNKHLILIHTGKVRLARNLLQNVIRNWYAGDPDTVRCFSSLVENSHLVKDAFGQKNLSRIGEQLNVYWEQKKLLAPGCEPAIVKTIMDVFRPHVYGQSLCGAGGGGFMVAVSKLSNFSDEAFSLIRNMPGSEGILAYDACVDTTGIQVRVGEQILRIP